MTRDARDRDPQLLPSESGKRMSCSVFDLCSDSSIAATGTKNGETFLYVVAGKVEITRNREAHTVEAGDSVYLDSSVAIGVKPIHCSRAKVMRVETE